MTLQTETRTFAPEDAAADQRHFFREQGYLVVRGLVPDATLAHWRARIEKRWGAPTAAGTKEKITSEIKTHGRATHMNDLSFIDEEHRLNRVPAFRAHLEMLGGGEFAPGGTNLIIGWPQAEVEGFEWSAPTRGHVDGYPGDHWFCFIAAATCYVYDVGPREGGTFLWPGSHRGVHRYFREHPEQVDGSWRTAEPGGMLQRAQEGIEPVEFTGAAGDVLFWHAYLCHEGSPNSSRRPRYGMFSRTQHSRQQEIKHEVPEDLFKYWA